MYYMQLEQYFRYYEGRNILVTSTESLRDDRKNALRRIFSFIGVDTLFASSKNFDTCHHKSSDKEVCTALEYRLVGTKLATAIRAFLPYSILEMVRQITRKPITVPNLDPMVRNRLQSVLQSDLKALRNYTASAFSRWSI
jgi:hypothetical protein